MPTRSRPVYAAEALKCFLSQTYPEKELVIIDDEDDPSFTPENMGREIVHGANIQYYRQKQRLTIGSKRNLACSRANGEVIAHWDSDDNSAPCRIENQLARLGDGEITGYNAMRFLDVPTGEWWKYSGRPTYALGTSLMYTKDFWRGHPFPDINVGEDNAVLNRASKIVCADAGEMMWARNHAGNTDKREGFGTTAEWVRL